MFMAGANSIFAGDRLLTTSNPEFDADKVTFFFQFSVGLVKIKLKLTTLSRSNFVSCVNLADKKGNALIPSLRVEPEVRCVDARLPPAQRLQPRLLRRAEALHWLRLSLSL